MSIKDGRMAGDLIFDIGLHTGDDAAYYLHSRYRVVGVEANPVLAEQCARRFEREVQEGRMRVVNAGVLAQAGEFTFYRNLIKDVWGSFELEKGMRGGKWEELKIPCVTLAQLIAEHGRPFFMKIDIEGAELQALETITPEIAPDYISLELTVRDQTVERLIELGYSAFKFVDGGSHFPNPPIFEHEIGWRLLRKMGRLIPPVRQAIAKLPQRYRAKSEYDPAGHYSPDGYPFTNQHSGPFGEQAAGTWLEPEAASRWINTLKNDYCRAGKEESFWWDVHARRTNPAPV
jgi:FkbM family methyltransferase